MGTQPVFITGIKPTYLQNYFYTPSVKIQTEGSPVSDNTILSGRSEWEIYFLMLSLHVVNKTHLTPQWTSTAFPALNPTLISPAPACMGCFSVGEVCSWIKEVISQHTPRNWPRDTDQHREESGAAQSMCSKCFGHVLLACKSWVTETCFPQPVTLFKLIPNNCFLPILLHC